MCFGLLILVLMPLRDRGQPRARQINLIDCELWVKLLACIVGSYVRTISVYKNPSLVLTFLKQGLTSRWVDNGPRVEINTALFLSFASCRSAP